MDEKQMLLMAAKAGGLKVVGLARDHIAQGVHDDDLLIENGRGGHSVWNARRYDGDALRLAVGLKLDLLFGDGCVEVCLCPGTMDDPFGQALAMEYGDDLYAATRLAIVRAAAAIGEQSNG